jgi:transposase
MYPRQLQFGKKRGPTVGPTRRGKGSKIMAIADRHGLPVAGTIESASPHETKLVEATVEQRFTLAKPKRMIGDRAYDSDPLDQRLRQKHRIRLIAPQKFNRRRKRTQDGRELRRYCRRWKVERLPARLHNFRRLVSRWEYHDANFLGMLQLGCPVILLRHS